MKVKVSEASRTVLDYMVALAEGLLHDDGTVSDYWQPSQLWEQAGPIIDREIDNLLRYRTSMSCVEWEAVAQGDSECVATGPTPLIAAMRCYVASKLGDEVEVPDDLL